MGVQAARRHSTLSANGASLTSRPRADHGAAPSAPRAAPSARRRSRRRTMGGGRRNRPPAAGCGKRVMATLARLLRAPGSDHPRRTCATGVQAHRCVVVGVTVRWPLADAPGMRRPPAGAHSHPRARVRGDGPRAAGAGTGRRASGARGTPTMLLGRPSCSEAAPLRAVLARTAQRAFHALGKWCATHQQRTPAC
jgi:hypothetical protein